MVEAGRDVMLRAWDIMCTAREMTKIYEENFKFTSKYVHATSAGHEAIQIATGMLLKPQDWLSAYYRDDAMLLSIGMKPSALMLQLMAKRDDPFSGGRSYYSHPSLRDEDKPKIPHQSSATGMQAIPTTGLAMAVSYLEKRKLAQDFGREKPVVVCSMGDASITEGEVSEAFQMAALHRYPILYLIQDNGWDISASAEEFRANDAASYARGFEGIEVRTVDGSDFAKSYETVSEIINIIRKERRPFLLHARVPLLNHHTSGVRMEFYRSEEDLAKHRLADPLQKLKAALLDTGIPDGELESAGRRARKLVEAEFSAAASSADPLPEDLFKHEFAPTPITEESGSRQGRDKEMTLMVDCALYAIREIMKKHPEALLYGQDVGARLGGVFREAATLAETFGSDRVFNTPIQEAFIIGSTVGMSAAGCKPIVEVQFADYIWPGLNQLFTEVSRSCYLSNGKWPVSCVIRVPIGAYGSGGPYHSSSVESVLANIRGIKIAYPSNGADLKGLMKAAYYDPNPVVILEHKGLYWSKVKGTESAKVIEPSEDYIVPLGKGRIVQEASEEMIAEGRTALIVTYGMGVHWALGAARDHGNAIEILDLRTIFPLDLRLIYERSRLHGRILIVSEEPRSNGFAQSISGRIAAECFEFLDAPVRVLGAEDLPAVPLNSTLETTMMPSAEKVSSAISELLRF